MSVQTIPTNYVDIFRGFRYNCGLYELALQNRKNVLDATLI